MNTPEQQGRNLARDMIALVEAHYPLNDERMIAINGMMGAFLFLEDNIHADKYKNDLKTAFVSKTPCNWTTQQRSVCLSLTRRC